MKGVSSFQPLDLVPPVQVTLQDPGTGETIPGECLRIGIRRYHVRTRNGDLVLGRKSAREPGPDGLRLTPVSEAKLLRLANADLERQAESVRQSAGEPPEG